MQPRSREAYEAYIEGFNYALELAARRMETANDETSRMCIVEAVRKMKQQLIPANAGA